MNADEYAELPYHVELVRDVDEDGDAGWVASVRELPGCLAQGKSAQQAASRIHDAMVDWASVALEHGDPIPEPAAGADFSGRVLLRMPTGLHGALSRRAELEGSSLNQLLVALLAGAVGWKAKPQKSRRKAKVA